MIEAPKKSRVGWRDAVRGLASQIESWRPQSFQSDRRPFEGDGAVDVLELKEDGHTIVLEPAAWAVGELPAQVDFRSDLGTRVRFQGPAEDGSWRVVTSDLVNMRVAWDRASIERLCRDLLYR